VNTIPASEIWKLVKKVLLNSWKSSFRVK